MSKLDYKPFYKRRLPHIQPPGATLFLTFRLANSLPQVVLEAILDQASKAEMELSKLSSAQESDRQVALAHKRLFGIWDKALDTLQTGPFYLRNPQVATMVSESLFHQDGHFYTLDAFCIMPNHVHLVCKPLIKEGNSYYAISTIMHSIKRYTARQANLVLGREGPFWQHESYDHVVRDDIEWQRIIAYVVNNPVKAGLVTDWKDWKYSYCRFDL